MKAYGPGLEGAVTHKPAVFTVETRGAGQGGLGLAIEGPSEAKMTCRDNRDGSCTVEYLPTKKGEYDITVKFADQHIPGTHLVFDTVSDNTITHHHTLIKYNITFVIYRDVMRLRICEKSRVGRL